MKKEKNNNIRRVAGKSVLVVLLLSTFLYAHSNPKKQIAEIKMLNLTMLGDQNKHKLIDVNGWLAKSLHFRDFYGKQGIYLTEDNYLVSLYPETSTDYEYEQTLDFYNFLKSNGINFLYVNAPTKYTDDLSMQNQFGLETYTNRNADKFLGRIREEGIPVIDLRQELVEDDMNIRDLFYRTDHHWTTRSGFWATKKIMEGLNQHCGYAIDLSLYDDSNYSFRDWSNCWLGEQGKKVGRTYIGLDDYTEIKPVYSTDYTFYSIDTTYDGTFDNFVNEDIYNTDMDVYENTGWHYSYSQIPCINNNQDYGKVLILGDSFSQVVEPFVSLGVRETFSFILRDWENDFDLRKYILENEFDTVLVCYTQSMIGAHDDPGSGNYRMFTFR